MATVEERTVPPKRRREEREAGSTVRETVVRAGDVLADAATLPKGGTPALFANGSVPAAPVFDDEEYDEEAPPGPPVLRRQKAASFAEVTQEQALAAGADADGDGTVTKREWREFQLGLMAAMQTLGTRSSLNNNRAVAVQRARPVRRIRSAYPRRSIARRYTARPTYRRSFRPTFSRRRW